MKKCILFFTVLFSCYISIGQINYSGEYGYSFKPQGKPPKDEASNGPEGSLTLFKIGDNVYRFWLDANIGWPSYNQGTTDGMITIQGDSAFSDNTYAGAEGKCLLHFYFKKDMVVIVTDGTGFDCGFGNAVYADGNFKKKKKQPIMNNAWLNEQNPEGEKYIVNSTKAVIYEDAKLSKAKKQYFIKSDVVVSIKEEGQTIYTEFIAANGKFIYGWIKKSDLLKK
jgi:hypothetical protein